MHTHAIVVMWKHRSTTEVIVPSHHVSPEAQTQVVCLGSKGLNPLSCLIYPVQHTLPPSSLFQSQEYTTEQRIFRKEA